MNCSYADIAYSADAFMMMEETFFANTAIWNLEARAKHQYAIHKKFDRYIFCCQGKF